ncbi:hypothetical protein ES705_40034 [subsurface metagenome]
MKMGVKQNEGERKQTNKNKGNNGRGRCLRDIAG